MQIIELTNQPLKAALDELSWRDESIGIKRQYDSHGASRVWAIIHDQDEE